MISQRKNKRLVLTQRLTAVNIRDNGTRQVHRQASSDVVTPSSNCTASKVVHVRM